MALQIIGLIVICFAFFIGIAYCMPIVIIDGIEMFKEVFNDKKNK